MAKMNYEYAKSIIRGSKTFTFNGTVLEITSYYGGDTVRLDLSKLTPESFKELQVEEPVAAIRRLCKEEIPNFEGRALEALGLMDKNRCPLKSVNAPLSDRIRGIIEDYCWEEGIDPDEIDVTPEAVLLYVDE